MPRPLAWMIALGLVGAGGVACRESGTRAPDADVPASSASSSAVAASSVAALASAPSLPEEPVPPLEKSFRNLDMLFELKMPNDWEVVGPRGNISFIRTVGNRTYELCSVAVSHAGDRETLTRTWRASREASFTVEELGVDEQKVTRARGGDELFFAVDSARHETLLFKCSHFGPRLATIDAVMRGIHMLPLPVVPPNAKFALSGTVKVLSGNCMPPAECNGRPVSRLITIRTATPDQKPGDVITKVQSGKDGRYSVALPPGRYHVTTEEQGKQVCTFAGECVVTILDHAVNADFTINNAVW